MIKKHTMVLLLIQVLSLDGCIEQYYPEEDELKTGTVVVNAHLSNTTGMQSIQLSRSSTLAYPEFDPLTGCYVEIENEFGNVREFKESQPGIYDGLLDEDFLKTGIGYRLNFFTYEDDAYTSEFEKLKPAPEIVSLNYKREEQSTRDQEVAEEGIQFYIDFEIEKDSGRYLRWQLEETYEIHNPEYRAQIFDVDRRMKDLPDSSSWRDCWITVELPEIYTLDLGNIVGNYYREFPLNFVSNTTRRLDYRYSLLVRQFALSEGAFWYWDELGKNVQSGGNLFDRQPSLTPGNICNMNDEEELVIGYFSISGVSETRIFVENEPGLSSYKDPYYCAPGEYPKYLNWFREQYLPVYLVTALVDGVLKTGEVNKECVDCRDYQGSTHIKPYFW